MPTAPINSPLFHNVLPILNHLRQKLIELSRVEVHDGLLLGAAEESGVALRVVNLTAARE